MFDKNIPYIDRDAQGTPYVSEVPDAQNSILTGLFNVGQNVGVPPDAKSHGLSHVTDSSALCSAQYQWGFNAIGKLFN